MKKEESWVVDRRLNVVPSPKARTGPLTTPQQAGGVDDGEGSSYGTVDLVGK